MQKHFPNENNFFPQTFMLPQEINTFKKQFREGVEKKTFIIKPAHDC